jgi:hypothetical protein
LLSRARRGGICRGFLGPRRLWQLMTGS